MPARVAGDQNLVSFSARCVSKFSRIREKNASQVDANNGAAVRSAVAVSSLSVAS